MRTNYDYEADTPHALLRHAHRDRWAVRTSSELEVSY
jgi:hypothetical protein